MPLRSRCSMPYLTTLLTAVAIVPQAQPNSLATECQGNNSAHLASIGTGQPLLACHPGKLLRADAATSGAVHPTRLIMEPHRNIPQRYMAERASITHVTVDGWVTTRSTAYSIPGISVNFGDQAVRVFSAVCT